ncbi:MAG: acetyl-CoA decarbonylase/synthase complex subunit gamma [Caldilineaceae bacterium]|nr:acetyl-CoA decarbonylase/synthase complex subunit gamma [Caldilineaceae bacterium]
MALSGLQIYKLLPQTNCKECNYPTCLAFAMKLAAKQAELVACPYVSDEAKVQLEAAAAPPIRLINMRSNGSKMAVGNETVLFRHEKKFFNQTGLFVRVTDTQPLDAVKAMAKQVADYSVDYVGMDLAFDGMAVQCASGDPATFAACVAAVREVNNGNLILMANSSEQFDAGLEAAPNVWPLLYGAGRDNWQALAATAKRYKLPLGIRSQDGLDELADISVKVQAAGIADLVLDPGRRDFCGSLAAMTQVRRLALKHAAKDVGFPTIAFPGEGVENSADEAALAAQLIAKYAGFVVLDQFSPALAYPLLVLRANIFTDPQKPIQVQPGLYEIHDPTPGDPVMVTTNFSITYFSVANEIESSGLPGWLLVADAEGMSVLTAWAAGKFDASTIAKAVKATGIEEKISHRRIVIPGQVAVLSGEIEEEMPGWEIKVGPREAVDLPGFLKVMQN